MSFLDDESSAMPSGEGERLDPPVPESTEAEFTGLQPVPSAGSGSDSVNEGGPVSVSGPTEASEPSQITPQAGDEMPTSWVPSATPPSTATKSSVPGKVVLGIAIALLIAQLAEQLGLIQHYPASRPGPEIDRLLDGFISAVFFMLVWFFVWIVDLIASIIIAVKHAGHRQAIAAIILLVAMFVVPMLLTALLL